jgi:hypothetical protein
VEPNDLLFKLSDFVFLAPKLVFVRLDNLFFGVNFVKNYLHRFSDELSNFINFDIFMLRVVHLFNGELIL